MSYDYEQSVWGAGQASLRWSDPTRARLRHALASLHELKSGDKVLELGCGAGQFIRAVKAKRSELDCHGCDISRRAIDQAKNLGGNVAYTLCEENKLPYQDNYFQAVLIFDVLEHVENPAAVLREVRRVMGPGAIFHCFVPCEGDWLSIWNMLEKLHIVAGLTKKYAGHIQKFSRRSLKKLLLEQGFDIIKKRYSSHCLGQWLDVAVFSSMQRISKKQGGKQLNNEKFFSRINQNRGGLFAAGKKFVNIMVNLEASGRSSMPSPNVHFTCVKHEQAKDKRK